jgi:hypothetical protein
MRFNVHRTLQEDTVLRCVWKPAHAGANAPLTATWIEVPCQAAIARHDHVHKSKEGHSWTGRCSTTCLIWQDFFTPSTERNSRLLRRRLTSRRLIA